MIPKIKFEKATNYMYTKARGLECARFDFLFNNGSKENVLVQLKTFQNEDGGFGHALEPDNWLPLSNAIATWTAGQILIEVDADKDEPIVQSMITYLMKTIDPETGMWLTVQPENNDHPHAPWWNWYEGVQENWMFNPSAELAAFLVHWSEEDSETADIAWKSIAKAINHLMYKDKMDKHEINNFQQLIKILQPHESMFNSKIPYPYSAVSEKILTLAERCIERDVNNWESGYNPLPLDFIDGPTHPLCERLGALVEQNLDFYIDQLLDDGTWDVSWDWGSYPKEFEISRRYWKGILTVNLYKQLREFKVAI